MPSLRFASVLVLSLSILVADATAHVRAAVEAETAAHDTTM